MAKSIADWYSGRESQSLELGSDDEYVERQEPWDLGATRSKRIYGGQICRKLVAGRSAEPRNKRSDPGRAKTSRKAPAGPAQQNRGRPKCRKRIESRSSPRHVPPLGWARRGSRQDFARAVHRSRGPRWPRYCATKALGWLRRRDRRPGRSRDGHRGQQRLASSECHRLNRGRSPYCPVARRAVFVSISTGCVAAHPECACLAGLFTREGAARGRLLRGRPSRATG